MKLMTKKTKNKTGVKSIKELRKEIRELDRAQRDFDTKMDALAAKEQKLASEILGELEKKKIKQARQKIKES